MDLLSLVPSLVFLWFLFCFVLFFYFCCVGAFLTALARTDDDDWLPRSANRWLRPPCFFVVFQVGFRADDPGHEAQERHPIVSSISPFSFSVSPEINHNNNNDNSLIGDNNNNNNSLTGNNNSNNKKKAPANLSHPLSVLNVGNNARDFYFLTLAWKRWSASGYIKPYICNVFFLRNLCVCVCVSVFVCLYRSVSPC